MSKTTEAMLRGEWPGQDGVDMEDGKIGRPDRWDDEEVAEYLETEFSEFHSDMVTATVLEAARRLRVAADRGAVAYLYRNEFGGSFVDQKRMPEIRGEGWSMEPLYTGRHEAPAD